jgi:hypothetical protein
MTLWHLAWMHLTLLLIFAALVSLPFVWAYARYYREGERFLMRRSYLWAWARNQRRGGPRALRESGVSSDRFIEGMKTLRNWEPVLDARRPQPAGPSATKATIGDLVETIPRYSAGPAQRPTVARTEGELRAIYEPTEETEEQ